MRIDLAESNEDILACFAVIWHLRDLEDAATFLQRVRLKQLSGYELLSMPSRVLRGSRHPFSNGPGSGPRRPACFR